MGSPESQSGTQAAEPVGAHEAREAAALNRMAETSLAPFLDWIPEEPSLMEKMDPHVQRECFHMASKLHDALHTAEQLTAS